MQTYLRQAIELALVNVERGGRPFGAVVVCGGKVIASAANDVVTSHDPSAHAELLAIRAASQVLGSPDLAGCSVYASGQPCPMCLAAMRLARVEAVFFAFSNADAEPYGLSTAEIYADLASPSPSNRCGLRMIPFGSKRAGGRTPNGPGGRNSRPDVDAPRWRETLPKAT